MQLFKTEGPGIVAAFGVPNFSPFDVSAAMTDLGVGHVLVWREGFKLKIKECGDVEGQTALPVIVDSIKLFRRMKNRGRYVVYVVDAMSALQLSNITEIVQTSPLEKSLRQTLIATKPKVKKEPVWELKTREPSLMDYVNLAVKPSQLNDFQTLVCKINPYSLRKEIQGLFIGYLASTVSARVLKSKLSSSYKLSPLLDLMKAERTQELKDAVAKVKSGADLEAICGELDFESFEIMYIIKASAARTVE